MYDSISSATFIWLTRFYVVIMLNVILLRSSALTIRFQQAIRLTLSRYVLKLNYLPLYYRFNDLMWQDGLLIDFLQKKVADKWIRRFLVCSSYLFSERVLFKFVVRFYIDYVVWPSTMKSIFDFSNVSLMLSAVLVAVVLLILLFNLAYLYAVMFI